MSDPKSKLSKILQETKTFLLKCNIDELEVKPTQGKWSKKEIFGHLIDSAVNNLQRFTEIQYLPKPYKVRPYLQNELVKANDYQNADLQELLNVWLSLNERILKVFDLFTEEILNYRLITEDLKEVDLKFWVNDYIGHMEYHLKQIMS